MEFVLCKKIRETHLNGKDEPLLHFVVESTSEANEPLACLGTDLEAGPGVPRHD